MMSDQQFNDELIVMAPWIPPKNHTWKNILRAVTIHQLLQAEPSPFFEDKSLVIEGRGFGYVTLVAHLTSVETKAAKVTCVLEDGTGKIYANKEFNCLIQGHGLSAEEEMEEIAQYKDLEHTYVEVVGTPVKRDGMHWTRLSITHIKPAHGYHQVLYHILNVIHSDMLIQQHIQPHDPDRDSGSNEDMEICTSADDGQPCQEDMSVESEHATFATPVSHTILPNTFSPRRHQPYAILQPLERAIMKYMCHCRDHPVLITELAQVIQASCGCTELQFNVAIQALLSEAYITDPLDDGHVVITPRH